MTIGQRIKQARKANNMSMRNLAEKAEISAMAISKYERDLDTPSSGVLLRLAQALGITIDFLFRPHNHIGPTTSLSQTYRIGDKRTRGDPDADSGMAGTIPGSRKLFPG